jgi:hypothetical protein
MTEYELIYEVRYYGSDGWEEVSQLLFTGLSVADRRKLIRVKNNKLICV